MAAYFRVQVNQEGVRRFDELARVWSLIPAAEQNNLVLGAQTKAAPGFLYVRETPRSIKVETDGLTNAARERLRAVSRRWAHLNRYCQIELLAYAYRSAEPAGDPVTLQSIALRIERLYVGQFDTSHSTTLIGSAAVAFAAEHGRLVGHVRGECWSADSSKSNTFVYCYGREIAAAVEMAAAR